MVKEQPCQRALTQTRTLCGGGVLEAGNPRLLEDGGERGGALVSDLVSPETAKVSEAGKAREQACQRALTQKRTLTGLRRTQAR